MRIRLVVLMVQAMLCVGCMNGDNNQSAADFLKEVKQEKIAKIPELPPVRTYKKTDYDISAMRDPFRPSPEFLASSGSKKNGVVLQPRPDAKRPRELLENYSLDSINMVGTIRKGKTFWAIVKDKAGLVYRVHIGNYLGENSGRIEKITEKDMEIKETVTNGQGGWVGRVTSLSLAK